MLSQSALSRSQRERETYESGLDRDAYVRALSHADYHWRPHQNRIVTAALQEANGAAVLELGATRWTSWLEEPGIRPKTLDCINISQAELRVGIQRSTTSAIKPRFHVMN